MIRPTLALLAGLALAGSAPAQDVLVREIQQLDTTSTGIGLNPSPSSDGLLLAVGYYDGGGSGSQNVYVSVTDGRGVDWTGPERVDTDVTGASKIFQYDNCVVLGDRISLVWKDGRNGSDRDDVYFNRSLDRGQTFETFDVQLDDGYLNTGDVQAWRFAASKGAPGGHDYLYVLMATDNDFFADEELFLVLSPDSGATWSPAFPVAGDSSSGVDVDTLAIDAVGPVAHIMWDDDSSNVGSDLDSVYYRRFHADTLAFDAVKQLDSTDITDSGDSAASGIYSFEIDAEGDLVAAVWLEERTDASDEEVRVAWSFDGGDNFFPDELIGGYAIGTGEEADFCDVIVSGDNIVVAYTDNRLSGGGTHDDVFVSVLEDAPTLANTWVEHGPLSLTEGGAGIRLAGGNSDVAVSWTADDGSSQHVGSAFSQDQGLSWSDGFIVSVGDGSTDADIAEIGYNKAYGNFVNAYLSNDVSTNNVYATGFRPATLTAQGWVSGATTISFDFDRLLPAGSNPMGAVILSAGLDTGSFVLPGGRDLGITFDALTQVGLDNLFLLLANVDGSGSGSTISLPVTLPTGFTIYAVGLGFAADADHVNRVTDVVEISF